MKDDCRECGGRGWWRTGLSDAETCDECTEGLLLSLNDQRDRILGLTIGSTDEDRDDVDAVDEAIIRYASLRVRIELMSILDEDDWRIGATTKIIRERIDKLKAVPVL